MEYENYRLCPDLRPDQDCIVVQQYRNGEFIRLHHDHVRRSQVSEETRRELLVALVIRFSDMPAEGIVKCYLNSRGKDSSRDWYQAKIRGHVSYPEPSVIRWYCGSDTTAWVDHVIQKHIFRSDEAKEKC
jgi:hypothetical protein